MVNGAKSRLLTQVILRPVFLRASINPLIIAVKYQIIGGSRISQRALNPRRKHKITYYLTYIFPKTVWTWTIAPGVKIVLGVSLRPLHSPLQMIVLVGVSDRDDRRCVLCGGWATQGEPVPRPTNRMDGAQNDERRQQGEGARRKYTAGKNIFIELFLKDIGPFYEVTVLNFGLRIRIRGTQRKPYNLQKLGIKRMYSSGMRTAPLLTVSKHALRRRVSAREGCLPGGEGGRGAVVSAQVGCIPACNGAGGRRKHLWNTKIKVKQMNVPRKKGSEGTWIPDLG